MTAPPIIEPTFGVCFSSGPDGCHFSTYEHRYAAWSKTGAKFRDMRLNRGWSLRDASHAIGSGLARTSEIERGYAHMTDSEWANLVKAVL